MQHKYIYKLQKKTKWNQNYKMTETDWIDSVKKLIEDMNLIWGVYLTKTIQNWTRIDQVDFLSI